jgi:hypothetical protein
LPRRSNHPAADQLALCRAAIRALREQEQELREHLLSNPADRIGLDWEVTIRPRLYRHINVDMAVMRVGKEALGEALVEREGEEVRLIERESEDR